MARSMGQGERSKTRQGWAFPAALLITLALPVGVAAAGCVTHAEREAKMVRHLQTELMIGALRCRGSRDAGQRRLYERFVEVHRATLRREAEVLRAYFERRHDVGSGAALDRHVAGLAGRISSASRSIDDFCSRVARFATGLLEDAPAALSEAAAHAPVPYVADEPLCRMGTAAARLD